MADAVEAVAERTGDTPEPPRQEATDRAAKREIDELKIAFMAARLREAIATANAAACRGELKVERNLRFGEKVGSSAAVDRGSGAAAPVRTVVFARDCYIELSFDSRQLKAVRHYIKLNPARRLTILRPKTRAKSPQGASLFSRPPAARRRFPRLRCGATPRQRMPFAVTASN